MIKKTYIPGKPRNPKLSTATGTSGVGKTEFNQVAGSSHEHYNKGVLDQITEAMLVGALRDLITSTDTESELTDENILSSLRVLSEITKNNETFLEDLKERFLSKIEPDTAQKLITFVEGIEVGDFTTGALGAGAAIKMIDGTSFAEVDNLTVRQKATFRELIIESLKHIGGQLVLTPARMKCVRVVDGGTFYKCYFDTGDGEVSNEFVAGDFARCQVFTGSGTKFYWRLVTLVGEDWINISKTNAAVGSDAPEAGDDITQLGNATDTTRQSAIILSTVGIDAPSWKQYSGINSFSLEGKETTVFSKLGNRISGETVFTSGGANLDDYLDGVAQDILDALKAAQDAEDKAQQAIEDAEANVATINTEIGKLQDQIDGKVSNWFYDYTPTLSNYPASDWDTTLLKDSHIGDTFTNTEPAPAENAGKSWRFVKNGSTYSWTVISDSDAIKALQEASKAQATADGKSTTHLFQPTKYKLGDMWVLNADQTVNGTAYKQGEVLTATQDSETFVQAHWLKRIRYTDDTAVNNLEIGGRNLAQLTNSKEWVSYLGGTISFGEYKGITTIKATDDGSRYIGIQQGPNARKMLLRAGEQYTISLLVRGTVPLTYNYIMHTGIANDYFENFTYEQPLNEETFVKAYLKITGKERFELSTGSYFMTRPTVINAGDWVEITQLKIEKGTKATDWTPAPEDVQAEIDDAKQEALTAASNAQTTADSFKNFTDTAFRDGIIDRSESVAIEKYKNSLNETMSKAEASYNKVYTNTYLEGAAKTSLLNAKINLWGQRDTLLSAINTAISGGTTTPAQKTSVDNAFSTFNNLMNAFQNAIEEANKAIQAKLDALSTEKVENIEIGGRNLVQNIFRKVGNGVLDEYAPNCYRYYVPKNSQYPKAYSHYGLNNQLIKDNQYTLSLWAKTDRVGHNISISLADTNGLNYENGFTIGYQEGWSFSHFTFTYKGNLSDVGVLRINAPHDSDEDITIWFKYVKIEKGTKATDWTPAPEDVEASIETAKTEAENAAKVYADAQAEAAEVNAKAHADGIVTAEEQARIDDVNDKLAAAKAHADAQDALLKTQQEAYADEHISTAEQAAIDAAKSYADLKKTEAQAYVDGIVSDEEARAIADAQAKYEAAKEYAEAQDALLEARAEAYADGEISKAEQAAIQAAEAYADLKKQEAEAYADGIVSDEEARAIADALAKFNASKAHAETLVDNLEIGGRNLLRDSGVEVSNGVYNIARYDLTDEIKEGEEVTLTIWGSLATTKTNFRAYNSGGSISVATLTDNGDGTYSSTFKWKIGSSTNTYLNIYAFTNAQTGISTINKIKLEKGNKATDWTPAPEDVQAEINTAKQEALTAAGNAQNTANSLKDFTDTAFRDGIVDRAEAKAIGSYINTITAEKIALEAIYNKLNANTYLTGTAKTNLTTSKNNYFGYVTTLIDSINGVIAKGYATPADTQSIDAIYGNYRNYLSVFSGRVEDANKAIQTKLDAISKGYVDDLEIGGRNLILKDEYLNRIGYSDIVFGNYTIEIPSSTSDLGLFIIQVEPNTTYTVSFKGEASSTRLFQYTSKPTDVLSGGVQLNFLPPHTFTTGQDIEYLGVGIYGRGNNSYPVRTYDWKLEKGTKATDWTPAPEDVDKKISDADAKAQALEYLKLAIGQDAKINGALYTLVTILLKEDMNADVTAGISGIRGAQKNLPAFWAGGTDVQAQQGTAKAIIRHDGSSKFTDTEVTGTVNALSGEIGGLTIKDGKLLIGDVGDHRIVLDPSSRRMIFTTHDDFDAGYIGFDAEGAILDLFKRFSGSTVYSSSVRVDGYRFLLRRFGQSGNETGSVEISPTGVMVSNASNTTEIKPDGIYKNGIKVL